MFAGACARVSLYMGNVCVWGMHVCVRGVRMLGGVFFFVKVVGIFVF